MHHLVHRTTSSGRHVQPVWGHIQLPGLPPRRPIYPAKWLHLAPRMPREEHTISRALLTPNGSLSMCLDPIAVLALQSENA